MMTFSFRRRHDDSSLLFWSAYFLVVLMTTVLLISSSAAATNYDSVEYGVDISFPMHHASVSVNYPWLPHNMNPEQNSVPEEYQNMPIQPLGNRQAEFEKYLQGCVNHYGSGPGEKGQRCISNEEGRIEMSLRQPKSMVNYTRDGFTKIRAPDKVFRLLQEFWQANKHREKDEQWATGNVYVNHWDKPTGMVSVEDPSHEGGGYVLKQHIWNAARDTIQAWTGQRLAECSLYGIRVYKEGHMLAPHVDRLPLVSSAIINVDQDVNEPWPLEVIGHDGKAHNITMVPGDLVLYESHSVLHGRPFPLNGTFMANVFIHFEPVGPMYGQVEYNGDLPPYVIAGSEEEANWRQSNPQGHKLSSAISFNTGSTDAHHFASLGQAEELQRALDANQEMINVRDSNGWMPLHEAIRKGDIEVVKLLLDRGADVNARTGTTAQGGSALYYAHIYHGRDHPIVPLLKEREAKVFVPEEL